MLDLLLTRGWASHRDTGWVFEPPHRHHGLLSTCASSELLGKDCAAMTVRLLRGRRWLCQKRTGKKDLHERSCDAIGQAWLAGVLEAPPLRARMVSSPDQQQEASIICATAANQSVGLWAEDEAFPRSRSLVRAAAVRWTAARAQPIPLILHQTWRTCELPRRRAAWRRRCAAQLGANWTLKLWSDADNHALVARAFPHLTRIFDSYDKPIKRVDATRYAARNLNRHQQVSAPGHVFMHVLVQLPLPLPLWRRVYPDLCGWSARLADQRLICYSRVRAPYRDRHGHRLHVLEAV